LCIHARTDNLCRRQDQFKLINRRNLESIHVDRILTNPCLALSLPGLLARRLPQLSVHSRLLEELSITIFELVTDHPGCVGRPARLSVREFWSPCHTSTLTSPWIPFFPVSSRHGTLSGATFQPHCPVKRTRRQHGCRKEYRHSQCLEQVHLTYYQRKTLLRACMGYTKIRRQFLLALTLLQTSYKWHGLGTSPLRLPHRHEQSLVVPRIRAFCTHRTREARILHHYQNHYFYSTAFIPHEYLQRRPITSSTLLSTRLYHENGDHDLKGECFLFLLNLLIYEA
jgi:hypothetical protein